MNKLYFFCVCCLLFVSSYVQAQIQKPIFIALINESVELTPFNDFIPIHPGVEAGFTLWEKQGQRFDQQVNPYLGFYHHKDVSNAFYLKAEYVCRTKLKNTIGFDLIPSLGYQHYFYPGEVYDLNPDTGQFEKGRQLGIPRATVGLGVGLSYIASINWTPFIRYEVALDFPQKLLGLIPHTLFKVGSFYSF